MMTSVLGHVRQKSGKSWEAAPEETGLETTVE